MLDDLYKKDKEFLVKILLALSAAVGGTAIILFMV